MTRWVGLMAVALVWSGRTRAEPSVFELVLEVSEQRVIASEGVRSYSEGVPGVVDVRLTKDGTQFVVVGQRPGVTSLLLVMEDGRQLQYRIAVQAPGDSVAAAAQPSAIKVAARDNVRLDFYFVQLSRDQRERIGVAWPASLGAATVSATFDVQAAALTEATAAIADQILPRLDFAAAEGWAKLLRRAAVITANGEQATFSGGGELNLPITTAFNTDVRQIAFGTSVRVQPRYDRDSGRIELTIHAEFSDLASDHGSGVPGRVTATLDSVVNLELGQSLVLAGLDAHSELDSSAGLPGLSRIPILGLLFGTRERRNERSENLILIVPSVVDAVTPRARERVSEALELFRAYEGELEGDPLRRIGGPLPARRAPTQGSRR